MDAFIDEEARMNQLEKSLNFTIEKIVQHKTNGSASSGFIKALSSLMMQFTQQIVTRDLIAFQTHARRSNINEDDVILMARKIPKIYNHLIEYKEKELGIVPKTKKSTKK